MLLRKRIVRIENFRGGCARHGKVQLQTRSGFKLRYRETRYVENIIIAVFLNLLLPLDVIVDTIVSILSSFVVNYQS